MLGALKKSREALRQAQTQISHTHTHSQIREREFDITKERIQKIIDAGANVILTTKGIDDMALKYFVEAGALAVRRVPKDDMKCVHVFCVRYMCVRVRVCASLVLFNVPCLYVVCQKGRYEVCVSVCVTLVLIKRCACACVYTFLILFGQGHVTVQLM